MAYGRKDYFWGVAPEKSVFGELQTPYQEWETSEIASTALYNYINYEVSAGYIFNVTGVHVGANKCGIVAVDILESSVNHFGGYFDTTFSVVFGQGGEIVINPGNTLIVRVTNPTAYAITFRVSIYGFLQQTIV